MSEGVGVNGRGERARHMAESYRIFVGIDWGSEQHQVRVTDATGTPLGDRVVEHTGVAIADVVDWVVGLAAGEASAVAVALEVPHGPIVDTLLERGCHVFAINPKQLDRFRDRFSVSGAKDDARDAAVLSSAVRTDRQAFRRVTIDDPLTIQLREFSRQDTELGEDLSRLANRLRDHLLRTWPELLRLAPAADERWLWALLHLAPTQEDAARLRLPRLQRLLRAHRIRRITAGELHQVLRTPSVYLVPGVRTGVSVRIQTLVEHLQLLDTHRREAERRLMTALEALPAITDAEKTREHREVAILQSLPGLGTRIAATMLAEAARALRQRDYHALRQLGGIAPVTKRSGKSHLVTMRYACDRRLKTALFHWGRGCIQRDARCRAQYAHLRQAGHNHARALRGVIDRMLAVLMAMLSTDTLYDATRRRPYAVAKNA